MSKPLTIGRLAQAAGVNLETIRYYQRIGLLTEPEKPLSGFRIYEPELITRIIFIKRAQKLGFKLQEIAELMQLGEGQCDDVRFRAEQKKTQIIQQISDLQNLCETLDTLIDTCHSNKSRDYCPIIETLTRSH